MSRRSHHPARRHARPGHGEARQARPAVAGEALGGALRPATSALAASMPEAPMPEAPMPEAPILLVPSAALAAAPLEPARAPERIVAPSPLPSQAPARAGEPLRPTSASPDIDRNTCTAPQLRRFIKSRAYVPMHELRRRFAIDGEDDDVTPVLLDPGARVYVGLPPREGRLLGELLRAGDIGYELSLDPISPIVVGVFPMRPVPRV
jgi:hypothetical protein